MRNGTVMLAAAALAALMLAPLGAQADPTEDNEENCLRDAGHIVIFSGADAGAARRGFNAGTNGCLTAGDPDLPFVDTNYLTPGATHAIVAVTRLPQTANPGPATWQFGDTTISIEWHWATDPQTERWESQSIEMPEGTGTVTITVDNYSVVHYQKLV